MKLKKYLFILLLLSFNASAQFPMEEIQNEIDSLRSLETSFSVTLKLKSDIETPTTFEMMDLTLDFEVVKVDPKFYSEKEMKVFMNATRKGLLAENFKNGGTYTFKVIRNIALMEEEPNSLNMIVGFTGAYERVVE